MSAAKVNPITLEVVRNGLATTANEMAVVLRKTESMQSSVQAHHSDLAERASDALGEVPDRQPFLEELSTI